MPNKLIHTSLARFNMVATKEATRTLTTVEDTNSAKFDFSINTIYGGLILISVENGLIITHLIRFCRP